MHSYIRPNTHIVLRLPSGIIKIVATTPDTTINIGRFGTFSANLLLGRPYYLTFEVLDKDDGKAKTELRVVPPSELQAEVLGSDHATPTESREDTAKDNEGGVEFDIVGENGEVIMRSNRLTIDDPSRQTLSMEEIEELKKAGAGSGKEIIEKIMASHMAIDEKTTFSLAKYTLRKSKKYLKRFTVLPLDVGTLTDYITEKEAYKIMELREESLGLISSWANVYCGDASRILTAEDSRRQIGGARWLVVDDTGGLIVAALAEKMGILYPCEEDEESSLDEQQPAEDYLSKPPEDQEDDSKATLTNEHVPQKSETESPNQSGKSVEEAMELSKKQEPNSADITSQGIDSTDVADLTNLPTTDQSSIPYPRPRKPPRPHIPQMSASTNTLTVIHSNNQPNLSFLKYFSFDAGNAVPGHPLYKHLKSLSWLQLLHPSDDPSYIEPEVIAEDALAGMKSSKRGTYFKKRRRWERTSRVIDETRNGGFDGLIVASVMESKTILNELVPLVRGGGRVVVYSPNVEPLVELCDFYSKERRTAFVNRTVEAQQNGKDVNGTVSETGEDDEDFPLNPTLLLAPFIQTARAREWQVLPGRTHPMMTSRGGAEGYLFTGTRVLPIGGKVEARGHHRGKKRKTGPESAVQT